MSGSTRVLHPDLRVTLYKLVERRTVNGDLPVSVRFARAGRRVDLTPFFSDLGSITTHKSVRGASGGFTLDFSDKPHTPFAAPPGRPGDLETLYGLIEPMDGIEIRMSHGHGQPSREPPIIMRGFVSRVGRNQAVDGKGAPFRTVTVTGHDYGKIWSMLRVLFRPLNIIGDTYLSSFRLFERFGINIETAKPAADFVREVVEKILNPHLAGMLPDDWPMPREIKVDTSVTRGTTSVTGPQNQEGSVYDIVAHFTDVTAGFNELFIEDRDDGVYVVFRPNPALDIDGTPIQPRADGAAPIRPTLDAADIVSLELTRSDQDVANYFWVEDPRFDLVREVPYASIVAGGAQRDTVFMENYPNNQPSIYGLRPMIVATQMGDSPTYQTGQDAAGQARRDQASISWIDDRRRILTRMNRDNILLEDGRATVAGNENLRAGTHLDIGRGALQAPYYLAALTHSYVPFKGFFSMLQLERGMGSARRIQASGEVSPFLLEMGAGAPYRDAAAAPSGNAARARSDITQSTGSNADGPPASTATEN